MSFIHNCTIKAIQVSQTSDISPIAMSFDKKVHRVKKIALKQSNILIFWSGDQGFVADESI